MSHGVMADVVFIAGLGLLAAGLAMYSISLMLVVVGAVLMIVALAGAWRSKQ